MKKLNYSWSFVLVLALLFTSCSKDEASDVTGPNQDTIQIQFGSLLNDFETKVHDVDPGECSTAAPSFVRVAITDADGNYVGTAGGTTTPSAIQVNLKNNNGSWETMYSEELGLPAGDYTLQYFVVYSADEEVLWVAPRVDGVFAGSVPNPLPQAITLSPGTKPYIAVDVLCFIPRVEEAYGYIFFDINFVPLENNYCIFVNYCDGTSGREYPANFQVDVWADGYDGSEVVVDGAMNTVSGTGDNFAATVLCFPLPTLGEGEVYYVRVSVIDAAPYDSNNTDFVQFTITQDNIDDQLDLTPRYQHLRINCGTPPNDCPITDEDQDGDCVPDVDDECPGFDDRIDTDKDGVPDGCDICPGYSDGLDSDNDGIPNGCDVCPDRAGLPGGNGCPVDDCIKDSDSDGVKDCDDDCPFEAGTAENNGCPTTCVTDSDNDGTPDCYDDCIDEVGPESNNGCPEDDGDKESCDTAWMFGDHTWTKKDNDGLSVTAKWGWAEQFTVSSQSGSSFNIYAGAGNNKIGPEKIVGTATITSSGTGISLTVTAKAGVDLNTLHIYTSDLKPTTGAPGQFDKLPNVDGKKDSNPSSTLPNNYQFTYSGDGEFWIAVHADVCRDSK